VTGEAGGYQLLFRVHVAPCRRLGVEGRGVLLRTASGRRKKSPAWRVEGRKVSVDGQRGSGPCQQPLLPALSSLRKPRPNPTQALSSGWKDCAVPHLQFCIAQELSGTASPTRAPCRLAHTIPEVAQTFRRAALLGMGLVLLYCLCQSLPHAHDWNPRERMISRIPEGHQKKPL
jgi:hypothetical protein